MPEERIHRILSRAGVGARRKCEELIAAGRVTVNGQAVIAPGSKANPERDEIALDGRIIHLQEKVIIMFNKPAGYITTAADHRGRPTVMDFFKDYPVRLFPVGRLDMDTEGLLLMTNDGEYTQRVAHPKHKVYKTYEAVVRGAPDTEVLARLRGGVELDDGPTAPARVRITGWRRETPCTKRKFKKPPDVSDAAVLEISIREGRKRQVRRMCQTVGHGVITLRRIRIGLLDLGTLETGKWRVLQPHEAELALEDDSPKIPECPPKAE